MIERYLMTSNTRLLQDYSFWGLNLTQFLGAFNDNLFKQLVLLSSVKLALADRSQNLQGVAMFVFSLPFVLFSGPCGVWADRLSKRDIIISSKVLEIVVMLLGMHAFYVGSLNYLLFVLFLMGLQSTYFGPAKYGILPEIFASADLPRANGWMLMFTFLSIILGVALAGQLIEWFGDKLYYTNAVCVFIAILGTLTSLLIRHSPPADRNARWSWQSWFLSPSMLRELQCHHLLTATLVATSVFWCVGGIYQQGVNDLGMLQLQVGEAQTSYLGAFTAIGIGCGFLMAGRLSRAQFRAGLVRSGCWGMIICLILLALPGPNAGNTLLGYQGSAVTLICLGIGAAMFALPLQVLLQARTPNKLKGQMIGTMNLCNFIGILLSGIIHRGVSLFLAYICAPPNLIFGVAVLLLLPIAISYRMQTMPLDVKHE